MSAQLLISNMGTPTEKDAQLALSSSRKLAQHLPQAEQQIIKVLDDQGQEITLELPAIALKLLLEMLVHLARGSAISVCPIQAELTTYQAAELLHVSRPHLIKLCEQGEIPFHTVGTHRRILLPDLLNYKKNWLAKRRAALNELTALSQELNLGY